MKDGQYITDRLLPSVVRRICQEKNINIRSLSDDWILKLEKERRHGTIYGFKFSGFNDSVAAAIAQDKVATYELLKGAKIPAVPHVLVATRANAYDDWVAQAMQWKDFVIKPTHGAGGRAIYRVSDVGRAEAFMDAHPEPAWCISPFLPIQQEVRLIMLDNVVVLAFEKQHPVTIHGLPMHNLRLGAKAATIDPKEEFVSMANMARRALNLRLAAIDIVVMPTGEQLILEVNEGFSLEHYMRQLVDNKKQAEVVYSYIIVAMLTN